MMSERMVRIMVKPFMDTDAMLEERLVQSYPKWPLLTGQDRRQSGRR